MNKELLSKNGWVLECESPLEIRHEDGSFATQQAANIVINSLELDNNGEVVSGGIHEFSDYDIECIEEEIECNGRDIDDAVEVVIRENFRNIFEMNDWDEPNYTELDFEYKGNKYHMEIIEDGCCEASWDGRIMYWKFNFSKL